MFSIYSLKVLMRERLTAVAEEILAEFEKITDGYEEEIHRQRELLEAFTVIQTCKPQIKLHRIDFPEQHYFNVKEVLANQQHCNQERSSSLYHEEPEALQTEEDLEKLCTTQQAEQLPLKQEADTIMIPIYEESDHSESESMDEEFLSPDSPIAESQDQFGIKHIDSELRTKTKHNDLQSHCNNADDSPISSSQCKSDLNFPQQLDLKEDEAFADEQLWNQVGCSSLEEPEPPCIKEETEELCNSQQGEQLVLKQEADDIMETQFDEESDHSESGSLSYDLLFPCPLTEILDELGSQHAYCGSVKKSELKKKTEHNSLQSICNNADDSPISSSPCKSDLNFAQQLDLKENETLTDEQLLNQAGCSSRDQEDLEEFCNSRQAEEPKQEADAVMILPNN
ncbi:uncharacterized protein PAE49_016572 isoform 2-T2 [Odontesthes bonariensis]|uniref:uncharacterized protein LOC142400785 isoform X2 n=1 Tax=Odontesthes bonariensis TaxID=219752 RepID=UPI003F58F9C9